jgi:hypothetical protein
MRGAAAALAIAVALLSAAGGARACAVCIERSDTTLADRLIGAEAVVLLREDADRPFRYAPVASIKGAAGGAPPHLLDSATRARLAAEPHGAVLALRDAAGWALAGYATPEKLETARAILEHAETWAAAPAARLAFFEDLLRHPDLDLRLMALDEVARAPYRLVRRMGAPLEGEAIRKALADPRLAAYAPVHILMLGLSPSETDRAMIRAAAVRPAGAALSAWATALIEAEGEAGVALLAEAWVAPVGRDGSDLAQMVSAFEIHARDGDPALGPLLAPPLHVLAARRPDLAGPVARALAALGDFTAAPAFAAHLDRDGVLSEPDAMIAAIYVDAAGSAMRRALLRAAMMGETGR